MLRNLIVLITTLALFNSADLFAQDRENVRQIGRTYNHFGWTRDVQIRGELAYVAAGCAGLRIIDISDPTQPELIGYYDDNAYRAVSICITDDVACVADQISGLDLIDISDPRNPRLLSHYQTCQWFENINWCNSVTATGDYAYIAISVEGMRVIDISDPENPRRAATFRTNGLPIDIFKSDDVIYLSSINGGLTLIDVSDPIRPRRLGVLFPNNTITKTIAVDNLAFSNDSDQSEIVILDVSDIENPVEVGSIPSNARQLGMSVVGNIIYLASSNSLYSYNFSDLQDIHRVGFYSNDDLELGGLSISEEVVYVAGDVGGFRAISISDPENLEEIGVYDPPCLSMRITHNNEHAYVLDTDECLRIVDVSDPEAPQEVATIPDQEIKSVVVSGDLAYLAKRRG